MQIIYSIFFGIVQALTEFLPISSSGHLVILHDFLHFNVSSDLAFDVALHAGTFVSLLVFFWRDIIHIIRHDHKLLVLILIAAIPAGVVGLFLESIIEFYLRASWIVAVMLVLVGILFLLVEKEDKFHLEIKDLTWKQALLVGLSQIIALIPGTSRSGITIITGMQLKMKREAAARFSFLMALPIFAGAALVKGYDLVEMELSNGDWAVIVTGFISSAVTGFFCIKYLLKFLQNHKLNVFAYYRFFLAAVIIILLIFQK